MHAYFKNIPKCWGGGGWGGGAILHVYSFRNQNKSGTHPSDTGFFFFPLDYVDATHNTCSTLDVKLIYFTQFKHCYQCNIRISTKIIYPVIYCPKFPWPNPFLCGTTPAINNTHSLRTTRWRIVLCSCLSKTRCWVS